jgi:hypothetical protein
MKTGIRDIHGRKVKLSKKGRRYPVDVEMKDSGSKETLNISVRLKFVDMSSEQYSAVDAWKDAVMQGVRDWAGDYKVFGGQNLTVTIDVAETNNVLDTIPVFCIDNETRKRVRDFYGKLKIRKAEKIYTQGRSFAASGFRIIGWKSYLPRAIFMMPNTLKNLESARETAKHEFGHVLGIGDMYKEYSAGMFGVLGHKYPDIEKYYLGRKEYNMVMCNDGPVTANDIEMIILAFKENKLQNYQKIKKSDKISEALGRGN